MARNLFQFRQQALLEASGRIVAPLRALAEDVCKDYEDDLVAVLFYGSCLWQEEVVDGIADFFVIVSSYDRIWSNKKLLRLVGRLLPPNVFFRQLELPDGLFRCKYAVISMQQLEAGSRQWFHSHIFGRMAQPVALARLKKPEDMARIHQMLADATSRLLNEGLGLMEATFSPLDLWHKSLLYSYRAELRPEKEARVTQLIGQSESYFSAAGQSFLESIPEKVEKVSADRYRMLKPASRIRSQVRWSLRAFLGKWLSLLRLGKAVFTFDNALDYMAYKIGRHSGEPIEIPRRVYKWPWLFLWGFLFKLWRKKLIR